MCIRDRPEWATLSWTQAGWDLTRDGYLTDTETVTVGPGRTLTLALRCPIPAPDDSSQLRYDQIQVLDGGTLLQTITPASFTPDSRAAFQGLSLIHISFLSSARSGAWGHASELCRLRQNKDILHILYLFRGVESPPGPDCCARYPGGPHPRSGQDLSLIHI